MTTTVIVRNPGIDAQNVTVTPTFNFGFDFGLNFCSVGNIIKINNQVIYDDTNFGEPHKAAFRTPDWKGTVRLSDHTVFFDFIARKHFRYSVTNTVDLRIVSTPDFEENIVDTYVYNFFTQQAPGSLRVLDLKKTKVDQNFENLPACNFLRQLIKGLLTKSTTSSFFTVLAKKVMDSPLKAYLRIFNLPEHIFFDIANVSALDFQSTSTVVPLLKVADNLWNVVLSELQNNSVAETDLEIINTQWKSENPINHLAAGCLVVLLAASFS